MDGQEDLLPASKRLKWALETESRFSSWQLQGVEHQK